MNKELFSIIESKLAHRYIIAIDGKACSGKTSLANLIEKKYSLSVFHMDDYFLPHSKQSDERLAIAGENIDHERFLAEVLLPLKNGKTPLFYNKFSCKKQEITESTIIVPSNVLIVEGVYSLNVNLRQYYDLKVFMEIEPEEQLRRLALRSKPQIYSNFINKWLPLEEKYFSSGIRELCDIVI